MPSVRSFDLNLLVLFDALYRERRLGVAATAVGLSQPAASQALARLRDALGDPLFVRRRHGMEPTPLAESIAPTIRDSLRAIDQKLGSLSRFDPASSDREFSIGLAEIGETFFFPRFLAVVTRSAPRIRLRSVTNQGVDAQAAVTRGEVDLAFDFEPPTLPSLCHLSLGSEELVVIARLGHPRIRGPVSIEAFLQEPRIRIDLPEDRWRRLLSILSSPVIDQGVVGTVSQLMSVPSVVAETDTVAVVPRSVASLPAFAGRLQVLTCPVPLQPLPVFALWHESYGEDPGHAWLRTFLTERFWADAPGG